MLAEQLFKIVSFFRHFVIQRWIWTSSICWSLSRRRNEITNYRLKPTT